MTAEEYVLLGEAAHAALVSVIASVAAPRGLVLDRDPVSLDEAQWLAALRSDEDLDENGDHRVHAWVVRFGGSHDLQSNVVRSVEPTWTFPVEFFYTHDFGTGEDNSEKRVRDEVLKVQWKLAEQTKMSFGGISNVERHTQLRIRLSLARMGGAIVHRGRGEIAVKITALRAY